MGNRLASVEQAMRFSRGKLSAPTSTPWATGQASFFAFAKAVKARAEKPWPRVHHPDKSTAWAGPLTVMINWKNRENSSVAEVISKLDGAAQSAFQAGRPLSRDEWDDVLEGSALVSRPLKAGQDKIMEEMLLRYGPLWLRKADARGSTVGHVVVGLESVGQAGPRVEVIDPASGRGRRLALARLIKGAKNLSIAHWPQDARLAGNSTTRQGLGYTATPDSVQLSTNRPWSDFFHFRGGTRFVVDGPAAYNGTGIVKELSAATLSFTLDMPQYSIMDISIPRVNLLVKVTYSAEGAGNGGIFEYNGTTYTDNNLTIKTKGDRRLLKPSIIIPGIQINEISMEKENADEIDLDIMIDGSSYDFNLERIPAGSAKAHGLSLHEMARGQGVSDTFNVALTVPLVNITHAGTYRLAYDRLAAQGYGMPEPLPARNRRIFRGQQSLQDALNSWAPLLAKVEMTAPSLILTGGLYVNKAGQHGQGLAIDVDGLWWSDTNKFLTINAPQDWYRYLRIEASLRKVFGTVLNYDYNAAHRDHWHCDLGTSTAWRHVESQVKFVQRVLNELYKETLSIDGKWQGDTVTAAKNASYDLDKDGHWDRFLDNLINAECTPA